MKNIPLTQEKFAIVDDDIYDEISKYKWYAYRGCRTFYAGRNIGTFKNQTRVQLHRYVLFLKNVEIESGEVVDHINGDGTDNRIKNLRVCTIADNCKNRTKNKNNTSGFKGVSFFRKTKKWRACIWNGERNLSLGLFDNKMEASLAYNKKAREIFGSFYRHL